MDFSSLPPGTDLSTTPAMAPPDGHKSDFDGTTHLQRTIVVVYAVSFGLATVLLAMRLYTTTFIVRKFGLDAPLIFLSWGVSLAFFIGMVLSMPSGFGKHLYDVSIQQLQGYLKLLLLLAITYIWPPSLAKLAIVVLYHRINPQMGFRYCLHLVGLSIFAFTLVFTILFAGPCNPLKAGTGQCLNNIAVAQAVLNIISDAALIVLPIQMIHQLNMPLKQRILVGCILALGSAVIIVSIVRVSYVKQMQDNPDVTWTQASAAVWSCLELNIGIMCNCLAMLKPFIRQHMPWLASLVGGSRSDPRYGAYRKESNNPVGGASGSFPAWRGDGAKHTYQLHSLDRGTDPIQGGAGHKKIVVVDEFRVRYDQRKDTGDASSTEDILAADGERPNRGI